MSALQLAILILAAAAVIALYVFGRRERRRPDSAPRRSTPTVTPQPPSAPSVQRDWGVHDQFGDQFGSPFDEFGVGEPRQRSAPTVTPATKPAAGASQAPGKILAFYIAEREGTHIFGPQIHRALQAAGLTYGARRIYHRQHDGETLFSVASLTPPGTLNPDEAEGFSTPGLSLFLVLPGPSQPVQAYQDMEQTARRLAQALNAVVFDDTRQPLTPERIQALRGEIEAWAARAAAPR